MTAGKFAIGRNVRGGLFFLILAVFLGFHAFTMHDGGQWSLSPALFPVILTSGTALLAAGLIFQGLKNRPSGEEGADLGKPLSTMAVRIGGAFVLCLAYALVLPEAGFLIATALFLALFSLLVGERRFWPIVALSVVSPAVIFAIFRYGLSVLLP